MIFQSLKTDFVDISPASVAGRQIDIPSEHSVIFSASQVSIKFRKYVAWYKLITVYNCITTYYLEFLYSFDILVAFNMRLTTIPLNRFQKSLDENQIKTIDFCIRFFYFALFRTHHNPVTCKIRNLALAGRKSGQKWKTFLSTEAPSHNSSD